MFFLTYLLTYRGRAPRLETFPPRRGDAAFQNGKALRTPYYKTVGASQNPRDSRTPRAFGNGLARVVSERSAWVLERGPFYNGLEVSQRGGPSRVANYLGCG